MVFKMAFKRTFFPTLTLTFLLVGFCVYLAMQPVEVTARPELPERQEIALVSYLEGRVEARRPGGKTWMRLRRGDRLVANEVIRTGEDGRVELTLNHPQGRLRLDRETVMVLQGVQKGVRSVATGGWIETGSVWAALSPIRSLSKPFVLDTPTIRTAAKGTVYRVHVKGEGWVRVAVYEGVVETGFLQKDAAPEGWAGMKEVLVGQALRFAPRTTPVLEKIDLRADWSDGWQHWAIDLVEAPQVEHQAAVRKALIRKLNDLNPDLYLSVEVELKGLEDQMVFQPDQARIRKIKIRSETWDSLKAGNKVDILNATFTILKQRYPNITRSVILEFDDGRPDLELRYAMGLKG